MVEIIFDKTLLDLDPFGLVSAGGRRPLHSALLCLYLSQVRVAALEKVPLIKVLPSSTASFPQAGSKTFWLHSFMRSRALEGFIQGGLVRLESGFEKNVSEIYENFV